MTLDEHVPVRELAVGDRAEHVALRVVGVGTGQAPRFGHAQVPDALLRLQVPLDPDALAGRVDQAEGVAAEAVHVAVAVGRAAVAEQDRDLVQALGRLAPEVPLHLGRFQVCPRVALLGVDEVGKLDRILDEEHRRVVADQVPVAVFGVEAQREAARVTLGVGAAFFTPHGRDAHEGFGLLACGVEQLRGGVFRDVVRDGEGAVSARALGVHHALGNALAVEVLQFLDQVKVLQQQQTAWPGAERVLVVDDRNAGGGGQGLSVER